MEKYNEQLLPKLKKLPVPKLKETLAALCEWMEPLITKEELIDFKKRAAMFNISDGAVLQQELLQLAEQMTGSWLAPLWEENYLESRGYLQSESNFALMIDPKYYNQFDTKEARAAQLIYGLTRTYIQLASGAYPIEHTKNNQSVDMSFYLNFFKSCRIPRKDKDSFHRGEVKTQACYVVIFAKGAYFRLDVTDSQGEMYAIEELLGNIRSILALKYPIKKEEHLITYFTSVEREQSALIYEQLKLNETNLQNLNQIENALFVLSFSQGEDATEDERINDVLLNTSHQFLAKTTQAIVTKNGYIGFNMEHSAIDGVPTLNMLMKVFEVVADSNLTDFGKSSTSLVKKIKWDLTEKVIILLERAKKCVEKENNSYTIKHFVIPEIGKERMKKAKVSPDAFFHIALAMAQQTVFGKLRSVYEPVAMRMYYEGRTECARSISSEKKEFVEAFYEKNDAYSKETLVALLTEAATAHSNRISRCQNGEGPERHLFGLKKMALNQEEETIFFSAKGLDILGEDFLSTTGIPYDLLESFSFGPTNKSGFGIYYGILKEKIILTISAKKENEHQVIQMSEALNEALSSLTKLLNI